MQHKFIVTFKFFSDYLFYFLSECSACSCNLSKVSEYFLTVEPDAAQSGSIVSVCSGHRRLHCR